MKPYYFNNKTLCFVEYNRTKEYIYEFVLSVIILILGICIGYKTCLIKKRFNKI